MNDHSIVTLQSGLPVILVPMPSMRSVTTMVLANTGSRFEQPREEGIAHFLEHMVFKGTTRYPDAQTLAGTIDAIGADFNAFTSKEYTGYYVKSASNHLETSLDVISDMLLQPKLQEDDIEREKGVIIEEINMYKDTPMSFVGNLFDRLMFDGTGLGHDIVGQKETVSALNREDFERFLSQWYGFGNLVLVVAGDDSVVSDPKTLTKIEEFFSKESNERPHDKVKLQQYLSPDVLGSERLHLETRETEQAHLVLGWPGLQRSDPQRHVQMLLSIVLGGNMSSRLFTEVREKRGLCYYVRSDVDSYHDTGVFGASAGVDPSRITLALEVIIDQFKQVASGAQPITAAELEKAKDYLTGTMLLNLEESRSLAQYYGFKQLLLGEIETPEEVLQKVRAIKLDEVNALAATLIQSDILRLAIIGPFKDKSQFERFV